MINEFEDIFLNGQKLPNHLKLSQDLVPNQAKNLTINGTLYVQYFNNRRSWNVEWSLLTRAEVKQILDLYYSQFENANPLQMSIPNKGLDVFVFMTVSKDDIKYNGQYSDSFSVTLEEIYAIS